MNNYYKSIGKNKRTAFSLLVIGGFFGLHHFYMEDEETCATQLIAFTFAVFMLSWDGYAMVLGMGLVFGLGMWLAMDALWLNSSFEDGLLTGNPVSY